MKEFGNLYPHMEKPFEERVKLFSEELKVIAIKHDIFPVGSFSDQFWFKATEGKIWYKITEPTNTDFIIDCIKLYRLHFPEGQGCLFE